MPSEFSDRESYRLKELLNHLDDASEEPKERTHFDAATAYLVLLQAWLDLHEILWPKKDVFVANLGGRGRGRPREFKNFAQKNRCYLLRKTLLNGKPLTYERIAQIVFPKGYRHDPERARLKA